MATPPNPKPHTLDRDPDMYRKQDQKWTAIQMGHYIRSARTKAGLSQEALGRKVGVSGACVSNWESGRFLPGKDRIRKLAAALHMPLTVFHEEMALVLKLTHDQDMTTLLTEALAGFLANPPDQLNLTKRRQLLKLLTQCSKTIFGGLPDEAGSQGKEDL